MHHDVLHAAASGAHGVVMGFLTREGDVDVDSTTSFVKLCSALGERISLQLMATTTASCIPRPTPTAHLCNPQSQLAVFACVGLDFTFHRAFDVVRNQLTALNSLIACRVPRVLTSGGQPTALQGAEQLAALVAEAGVRISIMPGAGVTEDNAAAIVESTGAREIHGTFRCIKQPSLGMKYVHPVVTFGPRCAGEWGGNGDSGVEDGTQWMIRRVADPAAIAAVRQKLAQLAEVERSMD